MTWYKGDEVSAANLNSHNHVATYTFDRVDTESSSSADDDLEKNYDFYLRDGGGDAEDTIICQWSAWLDDKEGSSGSWPYINSKDYSPDIYSRWEYWNDGSNGGTYNCTLAPYTVSEKNTDFNKSYVITVKDLRELLGKTSATGHYKFYMKWGHSEKGYGEAHVKIYGNPCNCKAGYPIRRYSAPTDFSKAYYSAENSTLAERAITAANLNTNTFGTHIP